MTKIFQLKSKFAPAGDQPQAIKELIGSLKKNHDFQTLLGVTGSGKTFTMAKVIEHFNRPVLVMAPNKALAAQLYREYKNFFPKNSVNYFVSYYDYYQPEAYMPSSDTYIEKEAMINEEIDRWRHQATTALSTRRDVIIVASVSCIYNLGLPVSYTESSLHLSIGQPIVRKDLISQLVKMQFARTPGELKRGHFRVRGDVFEIMPAAEEVIYRLELSEQKVSDIGLVDKITRRIIKDLKDIIIFPPKHFISTKPEIERAIKDIKVELKDRLNFFAKNNLYLEAERLERRTKYDMEMLRSLGYCHGIENYSRHLTGKLAGEAPDSLLSYFPKDKKSRPDFLLIMDESHIGLPQVRGMYEGDRARKENLIKYGWRLPSALDNRPLKFEEFLKRIGQTIFTSATPGAWEISHSKKVVEQVIRPTGLIDPPIEIRSVYDKKTNRSQVDDLIKELKKIVFLPLTKGKQIKFSPYQGEIERSWPKSSVNLAYRQAGTPSPFLERRGDIQTGRVIVNTLTKKMAEDLDSYLQKNGFKAAYLHSDVKTFRRTEILREFREGQFDILVGVNLLREGLDLPEVTLVAIMDADREGFLRSEESLIQTMGRAARNVSSKVILYADKKTGSMKRAMEVVDRRRQLQLVYNKKHKITPKTIQKEIEELLDIGKNN
ncbi:MAG: excinuclease ABC subunit B [Candidatus Buchananbacteria bacterium RIFCSPHIGHO2_01_FULL_40_35]|nr:MAG: excinuclease ABC subunit B [Candidatus Buchananbacteria bacterium RIFCSPHIGHO2_01_FULL_40_35]